MRKLLGLGRVAAFAAATLLALTAAPAFGNHVQCGDKITRDTTLDSDLVDCPGDGIVLGAAGVTLDLNGHTIDGDNAGFDDHGIDNSAGEDFTTVRGPGLVQEFTDGIVLANASGNVIRGLEVSRNSDLGIRVEGRAATENRLVHNMVSENRYGIYVTDEYALNIDAGSNSVRSNAIFENEYGIVLGGYGDRNDIEHNVLWGNGIGIELSDSFGNALIAQNRLTRNGTGIALFESRSAHLRGNRVSYSGTSPLISSGDGIFVEDLANVVEKNISSQNKGDGIDVGPGVTVSKNSANRNNELGIRAAPQAIDGGGNRAFGNGDPLQCLNVACK